MKSFGLKLLVLSFAFTGYGQEGTKKEFNKETFQKEFSEKACKCIDSIDTGNSKEVIASKINTCIDNQMMAYQLVSKLKDLDLSSEKSETKKEINIDINTNKDSKEYKEDYYELERYLMNNCPAVKAKMASNDHNESFSDNPEAVKFYNLGIAESKKENYAKAAEYYKKATLFDPNFVFAYDNLGITYRRLNEFDKAIEAYESSLKINPNGLMPLQNIAIVYQYKKEYRKAIKAYERMAKIVPDNPEVFYGAGQSYYVLAEYEKSLDNLCQAYNLYVKQNSPYRTDAEKLMQYIFSEMKKSSKEKTFDEILKKHNINSN